MSDATNEDYCTIVFKTNLRKFNQGNPFHIDTPFGRPEVISCGNVCDERDDLEEAVNSREAALTASEARVKELEAALSYVISQTEHLHGLAHVTGTTRKAIEIREPE